MGLKVAEMSEYTQRHFHQLQYTNFSQKKLAKCVPLVINWDRVKFNKHLFPILV